VLLAQAGVGYAQYFNDIPAMLVAIHIAGATSVWAAVVSFHLGLFSAGGDRRPADEPAPRDLARAAVGPN